MRPARRRISLLVAMLSLFAAAAASPLEPAQESAPRAAQDPAARPAEPAADGAAAGDSGGAGTQRRGRSRRGSSDTTVLELSGDRRIELRFDQPTIEDAAYGAIQSPTDGEVVQFLKSRPLKLETPVDLRFGETVVKAHNHGPDYPGVYSLWLKNAGGQWRLVFNDLADVWGTQHDPTADAAEVPLASATADQPVETFTAKLESAEGGGILRLAWGTSVWTLPFTVD